MTVSLVLLEASLIGAAVWVTGFVWADPFPAGWIDDVAALGRALALSLCCVVAFYYQELYNFRVARTYWEFLSRLPRSAGLVLILAAVTWAFVPGTRLPQGAMVPVLLVILALLLSLRAVVYHVIALRPFVWRTLILGDGQMAARLAGEIDARPHARYAVLGLVADAAVSTSGVDRRRLLGTLDDLEMIVRRTGPDRIIVALDERRGRLPVSLLLEARARGILVEDGIEVLERLTGKIAIESLRPSALVFCRDFRPSRLHEVAGRVVSLLTAVVGLLTLAPLLALIALLIKLDSRGPVLFIQERAGLRGRRFRLLKFRTMLPATGPRSEWVRDNGDRITRVGGWLRGFRLDELPQFLNILRGNMNLVGPRPHPMSNVPLFDETVPYYWLRSTVRPGVTGWAQVRYGYANNLEEETEKMRYDLYYIKHRSLGLDLRILLDTLKVVLLGRAAGAGSSSPAGPPERGRATTIRWEIDPRHEPGRAVALNRRHGWLSAPEEGTFMSTSILNGRHCQKGREMNKTRRRSITRAGRMIFVLAGVLAGMVGLEPRAQGLPLPSGVGASFAPGDVLVSLRSGQVQWWSAGGTLNGVLLNMIPGKAEGMGFDAAGNLYVTHYCVDVFCMSGNKVEKFTPGGVSQGAFGSGYDCNPYAVAFDRAGRVYVGQADCTGDLLAFDASGTYQASFDVAPDNRGSARIDLAGDGCTMFYTSQGPNVKRYDVCSGQQLPDFNAAPIPGGSTNSLRILPDGGVLVAAESLIARLDAVGTLVQTYDLPGEPDLWLGLDLAGDGTFWASNYGSSNVHRFDLATGSVLAGFNTGTPTTTVKDVLVKR